MKVADLRKLVSENSIFRGGLSLMKKREIIDRILDSEWYKNLENLDPIPLQRESVDVVVEKTDGFQDTSVTPGNIQDTSDSNNRLELENRLEFLMSELEKKKKKN